MVDKFGLLDCEDIWARQDAFTIAIQDSPNSVGYAVIYGKKYATKQNLAREKLIAGILETRKLDKESFKIIRGKESEEPYTEFWLVPASAEKPDFDEGDWNLTFSKNQKPYLFYSPEWDVLCPAGNQLKIYSEYLTKNPKARAHIVIYSKSESEFQRRKEEFLGKLRDNYNTSSNRIRFFFVKTKPDNENYELWLLP